jgi:hypothetical protein
MPNRNPVIRTKDIHMRLPPELWSAAARQARKEGLTFTGFVELSMRERLDKCRIQVGAKDDHSL